MKVVVQKVSRAKVSAGGRVAGQIGEGLLLLVGIHGLDSFKTIKWVSDKIIKLRVFEDSEGKMNRSVKDVGGSILVVSQFTLYGNIKRGTRPGFTEAAKPEYAEPLYEDMIRYLKKQSDLHIEEGVFGAAMDIELVNNGPVTILIEKE
ncbi:MAG: D-aminoacyl-tRNA deacylase [Balneolaceae bacterium]